ncbi:MAG: HD family hydrolase [Hyphomicrobiaceae bacterium]|nr:HD family hydrolase [Hyphomicrobiaceae bacterium]
MPSPEKPPPRAWQRMLSGRRLDLLNPSPLDIEIEDIAHGLARVARWNGQTTGDHAFSVAQHSLLVERIVSELRTEFPKRWRLAALIHDAPEYVVGDLITPFKSAIGLDYRALEDRLLQAVHIRFGLPGELPKSVSAAIKRADKIAAFLEATQLAGFADSEARRFFTAPRGLNAASLKEFSALEPLSPPDAQKDFITRFQMLTDDTSN